MAMLVVAIPSLDRADMRALAGIQHHKKVAFPTGDGSKFKSVPVEFVYITTPHHNQELIDKALALHTPAGDPKLPTSCQACLNDYPCETVRILSGDRPT